MFGRALFSLRTQLGSCPSCAFSRVQAASPRSLPKRVFSLAHALKQESDTQTSPDGTSARRKELRSPSGSVFIANVPFRVTAEQLEEAFSQFGNVREVVLLKTPEGLERGQGFVEFETAKEAADFVESDQNDPIFLLDRDIVVQHANIGLDPRRPPSDTLIAQHFSHGSEELVRHVFHEYAGSLLGVRIPDRKDHNGAAFVRFRDVPTATQVLHALHARMIPETGRLLRLQYAKSMRPPSLATRLSQRADRMREE